MKQRDEIQKRIDRKQAEIRELQQNLRDCEVYVEALRDTLKLFPRDGASAPEQELRPGSTVALAREAIQKAGNPLHLNAILTAIGRGTDRKSRTGLAGSLAAYVRKGEIFTRPKPNTFGLIGMLDDQGEPTPTEPPPSFGLEEADDPQSVFKDDEIPF